MKILIALTTFLALTTIAVPSAEKAKTLKAKVGDVIHVHYTGWLYDPVTKKKGKKFDSSRDRQKPFSFPLGKGWVIPGWDKGLVGMMVKQKKTLVIPPDQAYGDKARGPIPPNSTLMFDIEVLKIEAK